MELDNLLDKLKMETLGAQLDAVCEQAAKKDLDYRAFLTAALKTEWQSRRVRGTETRMRKRASRRRRPWTPSTSTFSPALIAK